MRAWNALLMVADVVRFSERAQGEQVQLIQHLLRGLTTDAFFLAQEKEHPGYVNSTGDGFVYATVLDGDRELPLQFCDLAARVVVFANRFQDAQGVRMQIRVGLHTGEIVGNISELESFSVGSGVNWCARICDLAADNQVLLSEALFQVIFQRFSGSEELKKRFFPPVEREPFRVGVKDGRAALFRVLVHDLLSAEASPKLVRLEEIGIHLRQALEIVGESVAAFLAGEEPLEEAVRASNPRLTLWVPDSMGALRSILPAVELPEPSFGPHARSSTTWPLSQPPCGPVSAAFTGNVQVALLDLPDGSDPSQSEAYLRRWADWNVPAEMVRRFSRHPRAILAIPLALFSSGPVGVVCVDLMVPLAGLEAAADRLMHEIAIHSGYFITSLLHQWVDLRGNPQVRLPPVRGSWLDWTAYCRMGGQLVEGGLYGIRVDVPFSDLEPEFWALSGLRAVDLGRGHEDDAPSRSIDPAMLSRVCETWPRLEELKLSCGGVDALPEALGALRCLKRLKLAGNPLGKVPDLLAQLTALEDLGLDATGLQHIPGWLFSLPALRHLRLGHNHIQQLPLELPGPVAPIKSLYIHNNPVEELPTWVGKLHLLETLNAGDTALRKWPALGQRHAALSHITLSHSGGSWSSSGTNLPISANSYPARLTTIPPEILDLSALEFLDVEGQPITTPPAEVVARGLDAIRDYWRQIRASGTDWICEAKLIIVGEPGAGKTSLVGKLLHPERPLDKGQPSTEGIDITRWSFPTTLHPRDPSVAPHQRQYAVNIWDFGGQEIYHATHQFFLTRRSLYVLVADGRREDTDFHYWLSMIQLLSADSPVMIVKNNRDDRASEIDEDQLRGRYPGLRGVWATNLATNRDLEALIRAIRQGLEGLTHVGDALPMPWREVRTAIEDDTRDHLPFEQFSQICIGRGFSHDADILHLSGYLHDIGICLHFQDDPLLRRSVILRPTWGTDAVYRVLDDKQVKAQQGRFGQADLARLWSEPVYAGMQHELVQLMVKFQLCYALAGNQGWIAPQLLSLRRPEWSPPPRWELSLQWRYAFMPKGILSRLIVALHHHVAEQGRLVWRTGVVLDWHGCRALITEDHSERILLIRVNGEERRAMLALVLEEVERIHRSFPKLEASQQVPCRCSQCIAAEQAHQFEVPTIQRAAAVGAMLQCPRAFEAVDPRSLLEPTFGTRSRPTPPPAPRREVFLSYAWAADTAIVDRLEAELTARAFTVIRDRNELRYRESINAFMRGFGAASAVVAILSPNYFQSPACMFELRQVAAASRFRERVWPVTLANTPLQKPRFRLGLVKHWETEISELDAAMKEVGGDHLEGIRRDLDEYRENRNLIARLTDVLADMRPLAHTPGEDPGPIAIQIADDLARTFPAR